LEVSFLTTSLCSAASCEASLAENRTATFLNRTGLERNLTLCTTLGTHCIVHLAGSGCALVFASGAAVLAALWSAQVLARVEFLLTVGEREFGAAIAACKLLISHNREKKESK
jgi:hypothetical protein